VKYEKIFLEEYETVAELITGLKNILSFTTLNDPISRSQEKHLLRCIGERKLPTKWQHK